MNKTEQTIEGALAGVREELSKHHNGLGTVGTPEQLRIFESELLGMLEDVRQGIFRPGRRAGMGRAVVDSWPLGHELTEQVLAAAQAYSQRNGRDRA